MGGKVYLYFWYVCMEVIVRARSAYRKICTCWFVVTAVIYGHLIVGIVCRKIRMFITTHAGRHNMLRTRGEVLYGYGGWYYASSVDQILHDVNQLFGDLKIWIRESLTSPPPFINRLNFLGGSKLCHLFWETYVFLHCCLDGLPCIFSPFHQMGKERERKKMVVELPLFGRLVGAICQSLWWAHQSLWQGSIA